MCAAWNTTKGMHSTRSLTHDKMTACATRHTVDKEPMRRYSDLHMEAPSPVHGGTKEQCEHSNTARATANTAAHTNGERNASHRAKSKIASAPAAASQRSELPFGGAGIVFCQQLLSPSKA